MNDVIENFFLIFAIRVNIATLTSHSPKKRKNFEKKRKKLVNLRYLGYINAECHKIYSE